MADVFISYSRKDMIFADRLVQALKAAGRDSWIDWEGIPYSADFWREIQSGIDGADNFVFIISPDSLTSRVCNQEIEHARSTGKRIIPIVRREPDIKQLAGEWYGKEWEQTARTNWEALRKLNYIFFRKKAGFDCQYDPITRRVTNPECDGPEADADAFDPAFDNLLATAEQDPDHVRQHTRLLVRAREWEANGRKAAYALRGIDLQRGEDWLATAHSKQPAPTDLQIHYILSSRRAAANSQRIMLGIGFVALVILTIASIIAVVQSQVAVQNLQIATTAQAEAVLQRDRLRMRLSELASARADALALEDPFKALLLSMEALNQLDTLEARSSLMNALNRVPSSLYARLQTSTANHGRFAPPNYYSVSYNAVYSSDSSQFMFANSREGTTHLARWDVETGRVVEETRVGAAEGAAGSSDRAMFSADGKWLFTLHSLTDTVTMWDIDAREVNGKAVQSTQGSFIEIAAVNDVGTMLAMYMNFDHSLARQEIEIWNVPERRALYRINIRDSALRDVIFMDDKLALIDENQIIFLNASTGESLDIKVDLGSPFENYRPLGATYAKGIPGLGLALEYKGSITLLRLDVITGNILGKPVTIKDVQPSFSRFPLVLHPKGTYMAARLGNTAYVANLLTGDLALAIPDETSYGRLPLAFSPDGSLFATGVVTGGEEYTALFLLENRTVPYVQLMTSPESLNPQINFTSEGKIHVTGNDKTIIWDTDTGNIEQLNTSTHAYSELTSDKLITPDGKFEILLDCGTNQSSRAGCSNQAIVNDIGTGETIHVIETEIPGDRSNYLLQHASEPILAFGSVNWGGRAGFRIYDSNSFEPLIEPLRFSDLIETFALDIDGIYVALALQNTGILVFDRTQPLPQITEETQGLEIDFPVNQLAVSSDGQWVVAGNGETVQIWNYAVGEQFGELLFTGGNRALDFEISSNGRFFAIVEQSLDSTSIRRWEFDIEFWRESACRIAGRNLTQEEWGDYFGGLEYHLTCPAQV